jgi:hypothetical protein
MFYLLYNCKQITNWQIIDSIEKDMAKLVADIIALYRENADKGSINKIPFKPYHVIFGTKVESEKTTSNNQNGQKPGLDMTVDKV